MSSKSPDQGFYEEGDMSALSSLNADLMQSLTEKRNKDGEPAKKRGPKPDSKPALTRRQELNRQAQRSHRERKEQYVRALENEVLRLKEVYTTATEQKDQAVQENRQLRDTLLRHGIPFPSGISQDIIDSPEFLSMASTSGYSQTTGPHSVHSPLTTYSGHSSQHQASAKPSDYEQTGIDFVLTLERPCMTHIPLMIGRSTREGVMCQHALMASHPPKSFTRQSDTVSGLWYADEGSISGQDTWQLTKADLPTLLDLSRRLDLDGEITPVMAWDFIMQHASFFDLSVADFQALGEELSGKVRCYGFGAVTEEFEVRDAIESIVSRRQDVPMAMAC